MRCNYYTTDKFNAMSERREHDSSKPHTHGPFFDMTMVLGTIVFVIANELALER